MANPDNKPQLPKNQSAISTNGVVSRDWYRFFLNLLNTVNAGGGGNGTGTVTSVNVSGGTTGLTTSGGPITTNGTITLNGTVNVANGGTGLTSTPTNGQIDIGNGTGFTRTTLTAGSGVSITNGAGSVTISATGSGTVTAVTGTTPISSSGGATPNISLDANYGDTLNPYASKTANYVLAAPNGTAGVPTFRAVVAADIPTLNQNTTGTAGSVANALTIGTGLSGTSYNGSAAVTINNTGVTSLTGTASQVDVSASTGSVTLSLPATINVNTTGTAANVTGVVAVLNGGTGQTSYTDGQLLIGNSTGNTLTKSTLTAGTGISITNGGGSITINATNAGAVTSVTGTSPIVSSGGATPNISLASGYGDTQNPYASKTANFFLAAPNGTAGVPTFRAVVAADIPTLNQNTTGTAGNVTGVVAIANGGTGQTTANPAFNALAPTTTKGDLIVSNGTANVRQAVGTDTHVLTADSTTATGVKWAAAAGGLTISNDTTTATNLYPTFAAATSGTMSTIYTGNAKLLYKPSTGELTSPEVVASNGLFVNSQTVSSNYTIPAGSTAISGGPITVASGFAVTVSSGARWVTI
jgi:trimeric autotransporter adhesin